jgi:hypothetical protein
MQPVNESLVFWVDKSVAQGYLARRVSSADLTSRARYTMFDGIEEQGRLPLEVWERQLHQDVPDQGLSARQGRVLQLIAPR